MRGWGAGLIAIGIVAWSLPPSADAGAGSPKETVERLDAALLEVLKGAASLGYQGRFARLKPVMQQTFDLAFMAEKALGQHWKTLDDADRSRWVELFGDYTVANYAANFDHDANQRFEVLGEEAAAGDTQLVKTRVVTPGDDPVELAYRLHASGDRWTIVDVYLKGTVSELALRRSDFASTLERDGFDGLVRTIRGKIADLAAGRGKRPRA